MIVLRSARCVSPGHDGSGFGDGPQSFPQTRPRPPGAKTTLAGSECPQDWLEGPVSVAERSRGIVVSMGFL
jgi:hypothetical protein